MFIAVGIDHMYVCLFIMLSLGASDQLNLSLVHAQYILERGCWSIVTTGHINLCKICSIITALPSD